MKSLDIAFFGSSLVSAYWNGAATYFRGVIKEMHRRGHRVTFYEPDAFERQQHRDLDDPDFARSVVYPATESAVWAALEAARSADVVIKASGVGVFDDLLESAVARMRGPGGRFFWDVDAPATLARMRNNPDDPFLDLVSAYDAILTYGGGNPVISRYREQGARDCIPIYNALDPDTHFPVKPDERFAADLGFVGNRLPDREARVEEFFFEAARQAPEQSFLLAGSGWDQNVRQLPNVRSCGHLYTRDHNAFNASTRVVLNVCRESMAEIGFSPATRVFEAAGAGACLITDAWEGVELFLEPGVECEVARNGQEVAAILRRLTAEDAAEMGRKARERMLREHTYAHRAGLLESVLQGALADRGALV